MAVLYGADPKRAEVEMKEALEFEIKLAKVCCEEFCFDEFLHIFLFS